MSDTGTDLDERELANTLRGELDDVEHALGRLDEGTYGTCEACGDTIPDADLAASPQTRACVTHVA